VACCDPGVTRGAACRLGIGSAEHHFHFVDTDTYGPGVVWNAEAYSLEIGNVKPQHRWQVNKYFKDA